MTEDNARDKLFRAIAEAERLGARNTVAALTEALNALFEAEKQTLGNQHSYEKVTEHCSVPELTMRPQAFLN